MVWNVLSLTIALFLFSIFMAKKYQKTGEYTISGLISKRYGQHAALLASVITIYAFAVVIVMLYVGGAATLSAILNIPMNIAIWLTAFIAIVYVVAGGMKVSPTQTWCMRCSRLPALRLPRLLPST